MANFNNLTFNIADATISSLAGMGVDWLQNTIGRGGRGKTIRYYYDKEAGGSIINVVTRKAVSIAASMLSEVAKKQYENFLKKKRGAETLANIRAAYFNDLIKDTHLKEREKYGFVRVSDTEVVCAYDLYGNVCTDALMLSIPVKNKITYKERGIHYAPLVDSRRSDIIYGEEIQTHTFQANRLVWYDTVALVSMNSDKELVLTKVQGRDYTRKELISNGDIQFTISGHICSDAPDVYPEEEVAKFYQIMRYKGVVDVNCQLINQFGINKIVIKSFNLPSREGGKSNQEYTFDAVGIQPDKEVEVTLDTVTIIDDAILVTTIENNTDDVKWSRLITNRVDALKDASSGLVSQGLSLASGYLDSVLDFD